MSSITTERLYKPFSFISLSAQIFLKLNWKLTEILQPYSEAATAAVP